MLLALIALGAALALTACGGSGQSTAEVPRLPRALASDLASTSDAIADALDAGDECGAAELADDLKNAVDDAIAAGRVPSDLQSELAETALELRNGVNCPVEPEKPEPPGKGKKKGHDDDDQVTTTIGTTTELD